MKIFNSLEDINIEERTVVALGNFDGVHAGHRVILNDAINVAAEKGLKSLCFTFSNHPYNFIMSMEEDEPDSIKSICKESEKIDIIENLGFDYLVNIPFDKFIMEMPAKNFFDDILLAKLNAKVISVGFNYTYGANASGNAETIYRDGQDAGLEVRVHDAVKIFHNVVSSTLIREALSEGNIEAVSMYLDREYSITEVVSHGKKIGKMLGIPTLNFDVDDSLELPLNGVYVSRTIIDGIEHKSITNIGVKPTIGGKDKTIETHVFDYDGDAYGKKVTVILESFIRPEEKFESIEELKNQIKKDMQQIQQM